jgi:DNA-binding beta-propeller fold protein YncE
VNRLAFLTVAWLAAFLLAAGAALATYQFDGTSWGQPGTGASQFAAPGLIAVGPDGSVYVADTGNQRVQKFAPDGSFLISWGTPGTGTSQFNSPNSVAAGADGSVYVVDSGNHRVQRFDANGGFISEWGSLGALDGQFANGMSGIGVGPDGSVYVGDPGNQRIERFQSDGTFLQSFGSGAGGFGGIGGIGAGQDGVYVVDTGNARVERFDANGVFQNAWGSQGTGDGQFSSPRGIAVSPAGVYVADPNLNRVQKFTTTGAFVDSLDATAGDPLFSGPGAVAISPTGLIYVLGGARLARYTESGGANLPPPETGTSANIAPVSGVVKVKAPNSNQFVTLTSGQQIPIGSIIDVTKGTIELSTTGAGNAIQTARFYAGVFKLTQPKSANPVTELQLFGSNFKKACGAAPRRASTSATRKKKVVRQLWGVGRGKFRTKGRYSSASIRGTQWLTQDRCDGTLVRVADGSVTVRDLVKKKNVIVNAPKSYLAKARLG